MRTRSGLATLFVVELTPEGRRRRDLVVLVGRRRRHRRERETVLARTTLLRTVGTPRRP